MTHGKLTELGDEYTRAKREYLEARGWKTESNNPGGLWMWTKVHNKKTYRCELDTAVWLQERMGGK